MLATRANHPMIVEALIELEGGMCVETAGLVGSRVTALMYAAYYGYGMCVSLLAPRNTASWIKRSNCIRLGDQLS